jgi:hypothetical protein
MTIRDPSAASFPPGKPIENRRAGDRGGADVSRPGRARELRRKTIPVLVLTVFWASAGRPNPSSSEDILFVGSPARSAGVSGPGGVSSLIREGQKKPYIRVIAPNGGEVWAEGETHEVRWKAEDVDAVRIAVAVGGKDRGHLGEEGPIDARAGSFAWTIPRGFVTGFGISEAGNVRIMIYDERNRETLDFSDGLFTITGSRPPSDEGPSLAAGDDPEYREAVVRYFDALSGRDYRRAYDMLSQCKVVLTNADGSAVAFQPRPDYERWLKVQESIRKIEVKQVERLIPSRNPERNAADRGDALATVGIRTYKVTLHIELSQENWTVGSGENTVFVSIVKGTDGRIRILEIGTGP